MEILLEHKKQQNRCVVRLRSTAWQDKKGIYIKRDLTFLRKQCVGYNIIEEDSRSISAEEIFLRIINFSECEDGIYEVITCNESRDWEGGYVDDYDYRLIRIPNDQNCV